MNAHRYSAYREALRNLEALSLRERELEVLRDAAEGHLLAPAADSWQLTELRLGMSIVLDRAVDARRLTQEAADELTVVIEAAGPDAAALIAA
jgi:hypothetical protein